MALSRVANWAQVAGFVLFATLTIVDRWTVIAKWGEDVIFKLSILFLIIAIIGVVVGIYARRKGAVSKIYFPKKYKFIEIRNKKFDKEAVPVDGYSYEHCAFTNVSFEWNGTAPFQFQHSSFFGRPNINTKSDTVTATIILLKALQMLKEDVPLVRGDNKEPIVVGVTVVP